MNIRELIELVLGDEKLSNSKSMQDTYRDEPILRPASQMDNYMLSQYEKMKQIARNPKLLNRPMEIFYRQAKLMEDFEDDCEYRGSFFRYFPTYQSMNDAQLRGYFTWRAKVRRGEISNTSLSFVYIYIYELLNGIGVLDPGEGFQKLREVLKRFSAESSVQYYTPVWLGDYAAYYGLDVSLLSDVLHTEQEEALCSLMHCETQTDEVLFENLCLLSSYCLPKSKFYKQFPEDTKAVCCRVFRAYSAYYGKHRSQTLCEKYFGHLNRSRYHMFASAVFFEEEPHKDAEYPTGALSSYTCKDGKWYRQGMPEPLSKSKELGKLLKGIDSILRIKNDFSYPLQVETSKYLQEIAQQEIEAYYAEKRRAARKIIKVDAEKLGAIRQGASVTRERLMTQEERGEFAEGIPQTEEKAPVLQTKTVPPAQVDEKTAGTSFAKKADRTEENTALQNAELPPDCPLLPTEYGFMRCLLYGGDYGAMLRREGQMLSVITDGINDKLYEIFGDTVMEFNGEQPLLIEDYVEELKRMILP